MANSLKVDPTTGDYILGSDGNPIEDETLLTPAYIRIRTPRTKWLYAPDDTYGSDYYTAHRRLPDFAILDQMGQAALDPLVTDGRAQSVNVQTTGTARGEDTQTAEIVDATGQPQTLNFTPLGGS